MNKLIKSILLPLVILGAAFTPKVITKIVTTGLVVTALDYKAQFLTKAEADTLYKLKSYIPVLSDVGGGYSVTVDGTAQYALPPVDYNRDLQSKPSLSAVAITGSYYDLGYTPDLNNLPQYWNKFESDTLYCSSRNTITIMNGTTSIINNMQGSSTFSLPTIMNYSVGYGEVMTGTSPNMMISVDTTSIHGIMSKDRASNSIALINTNIDSKQSKLNGSGLARATGTVITYDNTSYLSSESQSLSITGQNLSIKNGSITINTIVIPTTSTSYGAGSGINVTGSVISNIAQDQVITLTSGNNDLTITGTYPNFILTPYVPTTYTVTRSINSSTFQPSSNRRCSVLYNISINCTATIAGASSGKVLLQYSIDNGITWLDAPELENSNTVSLAVVLQSVTKQTATVGMNDVPPGTKFKIVPTSNGTTTITYIRGFETY